jgi:hypothetical protein
MSPSSRRPVRGGAIRTSVLAAVAALAVTAVALAGSARAAALPAVSVTISATSIAVAGTPESGAVNIVTTATGVKEASTSLFLLKPGVSGAEFIAFLGTPAARDENAASRYGSIVFDAEAAAGKPAEAQTILQPGQYVALNTEGEKASKWTHTTFTVTAAPAPAAPPAAAATERTIDFRFAGPRTLRHGQLVRFVNDGYVVHMDLAFPVRSSAAGAKLVKALTAGNERQAEKLVAGPPVDFAGPLSTGGFQQETITAPSGWYVQVCFMDTQDGRSHNRLGMERVIKITR